MALDYYDALICLKVQKAETKEDGMHECSFQEIERFFGTVTEPVNI